MPITSGLCECGCGGRPAGTESRFLPGHDSRLRARLLREASEGRIEALEELISRAWVDGTRLGSLLRQAGVDVSSMLPPIQFEPPIPPDPIPTPPEWTVSIRYDQLGRRLYQDDTGHHYDHERTRYGGLYADLCQCEDCVRERAWRRAQQNLREGERVPIVVDLNRSTNARNHQSTSSRMSPMPPNPHPELMRIANGLTHYTELTPPFVNLIDGRRFGVEIECVLPRYVENNQWTGVGTDVFAYLTETQGLRAVVESYNHTPRPHWKITTDGSLNCPTGYIPWEIVSPILSRNDGACQVMAVCKALTRIDSRVNRSCGLHVHLEAMDLDREDIRRLVMNYATVQTAIDTFMARSRREGRNQYCRPWTELQLSSLMDRVNYPHVRDLSYVADRYTTVNLHPLVRQGTIEFRQHGGTIDHRKIIGWVVFCQSMVQAAIDGTVFVPACNVDELADQMQPQLHNEIRNFLRRRVEEVAGE